jgi:hypothetical protein
MGEALWAGLMLGGICGLGVTLGLIASTDWSAATIKTIGMVVGLAVMVMVFVVSAS